MEIAGVGCIGEAIKAFGKAMPEPGCGMFPAVTSQN
jgi:hypothetical protein